MSKTHYKNGMPKVWPWLTAEDMHKGAYDVWIDIEGDYVLRVDGCEPWVDLATGIRFDDTEVEAIAPIDVKLVRA